LCKFCHQYGHDVTECRKTKAKSDTNPQDAQPVEQDSLQHVMQKGKRHEQIKDSTTISGERHVTTLVSRERNIGSQGIQKFQGQQIKHVQEHHESAEWITPTKTTRLTTSSQNHQESMNSFQALQKSEASKHTKVQGHGGGQSIPTYGNG